MSSVNPASHFNVGDVVANDWTGGTPTKYGLVLYSEKDIAGSERTKLEVMSLTR